MATTKRALRQRFRGLRQALSASVVAERSAALTRHVQGLQDYRSAARVAAFVGVGGEPDTRALLRAALQEGKSVFLPRVVSKTALVFACVQSLDELVQARFGLLEPPPGAPTLPSLVDVDVVIVPGVAFDRSGGRLGQGGGYYDRMLVTSKAVRVGICFHEFVDPTEGIPMDETDQRVDWVVTERTAIRCR